jgi:3-oxoacid CoA-transferase subunit A
VYGDTRENVLEAAIVADSGLVRAWKVDRHGNLVYRDSARNFNPLAAMCGRVTLAEVQHLVEPGELDPHQVRTPGVFVQPVVALTSEQADDKRIEKREQCDRNLRRSSLCLGVWAGLVTLGVCHPDG